MRPLVLAQAARTGVETCLDVQAGEQVVVVTDTLRPPEVPQALLEAATATGADPVLAVFAARERSPSEPPSAVVEAMCQADATILYTTASLSHSQARLRAQQAGTRVISAPGLSEDGFIRTLSIDVPALADLTLRRTVSVEPGAIWTSSRPGSCSTSRQREASPGRPSSTVRLPTSGGSPGQCGWSSGRDA